MTGGSVKPTFSSTDVSPLAVNPGTTTDDRANAKRVFFREPPARDGLEWAHEDDERL